jgi:hypothetical protein
MALENFKMRHYFQRPCFSYRRHEERGPTRGYAATTREEGMAAFARTSGGSDYLP